MKYYDEHGNEIDFEEIDLEKGFTRTEDRVKEHHDAIPYKEAEGHTYPGIYYFSDHTSYSTTGEDDPHILKINDTHWDYKNIDDNEDKTVFGIDLIYVEDEPEQEAKPEWDEFETVVIYHAYTDEELQNIQSAKAKQESMDAFFNDNSGPNRLDNAETTIDDLILTMADMIAG